MQHPIAGKALYLYLLVWSLIIVIHGLLLHQLYGLTYRISFSDALLYYVPLSGFGLSLYYLVRFFRGAGGLAVNTILVHLIGAAVLALINTMIWKAGSELWMEGPYGAAFVESNLEWRLVSGTLLLVIILLFYYLMDNLYRLRVRETREKSLEALLRDTEMEMLRFQINPHFVFNSLNSISALTMENPERAQEMVIRLSDFFRNALSANRERNHSLREELNQIDLYLQIERVRFGERLILENEIDETCLDRQVPSLILQPVYENAIKYGLYEQLEAVEIRTHVTCSEAGIQISVSNPYDSMAEVKKGRGIGLKNVRSRLELMYHIPDLVTIEKKKNHFTVHIFIPALDEAHHPADR